MAQNTNFKGNKNNNQKKKLPYIKVKIDKIISLEESKTKAFASVTIGGAVVVHGVRIMNSAKGLFVAMPANVYVDDNSEKHFKEIAHPVSKEARALLNNNENIKTSPNTEQTDSENTIASEQEEEPTEEPENSIGEEESKKQRKVVIKT